MDIYLITSSTKQINAPVQQRQTAPYDTNPFLQPRVHESRGVRELYGYGMVTIFKRVLLCCDQGIVLILNLCLESAASQMFLMRKRPM